MHGHTSIYRQKLQDTSVLIIIMKATIRTYQKNCLLDQLFRSLSPRFCWSVLKATFLVRSQNFESECYLHHACPSVRKEQIGFHWTDFPKFLFLRILRNL